MTVLVDTNLLVYAAMPAMDEPVAARAWLEARFRREDDVVGLSWSSVYGFVRLVSNRRVMGEDAVPVPEAWRAAGAYLDQPTTRIVHAGELHRAIATELIDTPGLTANDAPDIHLAALAIEHGLVLCTHDHGFGRYRGLRWRDPLLTAS